MADIAFELRRGLPGLGTEKLHTLLYYCQGRYLVDLGRPLFDSSIAVWDMGPVMGGLWRQEQAGGLSTTGRPPNQAALNTVGFVVSRYGRLTGRDLEIRTHGEPPWNAARARAESIGARSPKIAHTDLVDFFASPGDLEDDAVSEPAPDEVFQFLQCATQRLATVPRLDDLARLRGRLTNVAD